MDISVSSLGSIMNSIAMEILIMTFGTYTHAFLFSIYLRGEILGHGICIFSTLVDNANTL